MKPPALLDVNVLIALIDPEHQFHARAHEWFGQNRRYGWATCAITQNGCMRVMSSPGYPFPGLTPARVRDILSELTRLNGHTYWAASTSMLDASRFDLAGVAGKHLTDLYLLGVAAEFGGRLVTFDRAVSWQRVIGCGPDSVAVL